MPRHPDTPITPNTALSDARERLPSPRRAGQCMSRGELADAVNATLDRLYPGRDLTAHYAYRTWIGKLERGEHRWPSDERRTALRHVLGAATDADLGLYNPRRTDPVRPDDEADAPLTQLADALAHSASRSILSLMESATAAAADHHRWDGRSLRRCARRYRGRNCEGIGAVSDVVGRFRHQAGAVGW